MYDHSSHSQAAQTAMPTFADYFARNQGSLTDEQQQVLQRKRVAIIGCGGLGGYVIEELGRIGVGHLHLFDPDVFSPSNCNRQLNALNATLGYNKATVAAQRVKDMHPYCMVTVFAEDFRAVPEAEGFACDAVIDCLDDITARRDLAGLCIRCRLPLIHGAVNGWYGQVGVQPPNGDLIDRLYPVRSQKNAVLPPPSVLSFTVAVVAGLQAAETVKVLLGLWTALDNTWMHIDLKEGDFLLQEV